jgi:hypothetical protein
VNAVGFAGGVFVKHIKHCSSDILDGQYSCCHETSSIFLKLNRFVPENPYTKMKFVPCNFENGKKMIRWNPGKGPEMPHVHPVPCPKFAITLGEEMEEALIEWYAKEGRSPPQDELEICRQTDAIETKESERLYTMAKPKPVYGTPEFWKDYWARKKAGLVKPSKQETAKKQKS